MAAYLDPSIIVNETLIKKKHINELIDKVINNQSKAKINKISLSELADADKTASVADVKKLTTAINILEENYSNNCCQSTANYDCCQKCQGCQSCESSNTSCQSTIAACQSCQECQAFIYGNLCRSVQQGGNG